jgi:hypothetical protein
MCFREQKKETIPSKAARKGWEYAKNALSFSSLRLRIIALQNGVLASLHPFLNGLPLPASFDA